MGTVSPRISHCSVVILLGKVQADTMRMSPWFLLLLTHGIMANYDYHPQRPINHPLPRTLDTQLERQTSQFFVGPTFVELLKYFGGGILYLNMILGSNNGFSNLTNQIQNLTTNVSTYKDEIISKIEDTEHLLNHFLIFWPFLNHSDHGSHHLHHEYSEEVLNEIVPLH